MKRLIFICILYLLFCSEITGVLVCVFVVARFDFSWGEPEYHQETLENLKIAVKSTKKLCAVCILTLWC